MEYKIIDGMKNEGKPVRNAMIFMYILTILMPLWNCLLNNEKYSNKDIILIAIYCFMFGTVGLYCWLYAIKYKVKINEEKVLLTTLFRNVEVDICDIEGCTCKRYRKSVFYQFNLFLKDKRVLVNTRYKDEFENILKDKKIEQIIKKK